MSITFQCPAAPTTMNVDEFDCQCDWESEGVFDPECSDCHGTGTIVFEIPESVGSFNVSNWIGPARCRSATKTWARSSIDAMSFSEQSETLSFESVSSTHSAKGSKSSTTSVIVVHAPSSVRCLMDTWEIASAAFCFCSKWRSDLTHTSVGVDKRQRL